MDLSARREAPVRSMVKGASIARGSDAEGECKSTKNCTGAGEGDEGTTREWLSSCSQLPSSPPVRGGASVRTHV